MHRSPSRALRCALIPLLAALLLAAAPTQAAGGKEQAVAAKLSQARQSAGLPALSYSPALTRQSRKYARQMLRQGRWAHDSHRGQTGEILAVWHGSGGTPSRIVQMWMGSSVHRGLILDRQYRRVGVAAVSGRFQGRKSTIWVARLAR